MASNKIYVDVNYEDKYVQPLLIAALRRQLPEELLVFVDNVSEVPPGDHKILQWRQYESIDFDRLIEPSSLSIANTYVIRKALIRKHYLANTVAHWSSKYSDSILQKHVKPSVEFEVDYAEFLDDALVEAFELRESWARNDDRDACDREWWILKPGMSDRGQGIRLFSTEEELVEIFEEWDPPSDDEETSDAEEYAHGADEAPPSPATASNGVVTSQLRHFVAQSYIHPPLLLGQPHPSVDRKFHIRVYVVAVGALQVYVYRPMLALFAAHPYQAGFCSASPNDDLGRHLTNTCLQSGEREGSVHAFWSLPATHKDYSADQDEDWREDVFRQICGVVGELFEAAARSMGIHFQTLPNAFEIFGLDFLVDGQGVAWLLEVNSFPDFAQTGDELKSLIAGLFEGTVEKAIKPFFGLAASRKDASGDKNNKGVDDTMVQVLNIDLGRH